MWMGLGSFDVPACMGCFVVVSISVKTGHLFPLVPTMLRRLNNVQEVIRLKVKF